MLKLTIEQRLERARIKSRKYYAIKGHKRNDDSAPVRHINRIFGYKAGAGMCFHHHDYSKPKECFIISKRLHRIFHLNAFLVGNIYMTKEGSILDTSQKHHVHLIMLKFRHNIESGVKFAVAKNK